VLNTSVYIERYIIVVNNKETNIIADDNINETNVLNIEDTQEKLNVFLKE
jgi:hypothetical protein